MGDYIHAYAKFMDYENSRPYRAQKHDRDCIIRGLSIVPFESRLGADEKRKSQSPTDPVRKIIPPDPKRSPSPKHRSQYERSNGEKECSKNTAIPDSIEIFLGNWASPIKAEAEKPDKAEQAHA